MLPHKLRKKEEIRKKDRHALAILRVRKKNSTYSNSWEKKVFYRGKTSDKKKKKKGKHDGTGKKGKEKKILALVSGGDGKKCSRQILQGGGGGGGGFCFGFWGGGGGFVVGGGGGGGGGWVGVGGGGGGGGYWVGFSHQISQQRKKNSLKKKERGDAIPTTLKGAAVHYMGKEGCHPKRRCGWLWVGEKRGEKNITSGKGGKAEEEIPGRERSPCPDLFQEEKGRIGGVGTPSSYKVKGGGGRERECSRRNWRRRKPENTVCRGVLFLEREGEEAGYCLCIFHTPLEIEKKGREEKRRISHLC